MTASRSLPGVLLGLLPALLCAPVCAADMIRVVDEGGIRDEWTLPPGYKLALPGYPAQYADRQAEACVAIGYRRKMDAALFDRLEVDPLRGQRDQALRSRMNESGGMGN